MFSYRRTMHDFETFVGKRGKYYGFSYNIYEYYKCKGLDGIAISRYDDDHNTIECHLPEQQSNKTPIPDIKFRKPHFIECGDKKVEKSFEVQDLEPPQLRLEYEFRHRILTF